MRKALKSTAWIGVAITIFRWVYNSVDAIGNFQTAKALIPRMPEAAQFVVHVLYWPATGPIICLGCIAGIFLLDRRKAEGAATIPPPLLLEQTMFTAIGRLGNLLDEGERMMGEFGEQSPTRKQVDQWWTLVLAAAKEKALEGYVFPKDITALQQFPINETEMLLKAAEIADSEKGNWILESERIETYDVLYAHVGRLQRLIDQISSR